MKQKAQPPKALTQLEHRFQSWRQEQSKQRRIPEPMWQAAVEAARVNGISRVAQTLGLSYTALKGRVLAVAPPVTVSAGPPGFLEVKSPSWPWSMECTIQLEKPNGAKMTLRMAQPSSSALVALTQTFWSQGQ